VFVMLINVFVMLINGVFAFVQEYHVGHAWA
jgi:hypothetical protein